MGKNPNEKSADISEDASWLTSVIDHALLELEDLKEWEKTAGDQGGLIGNVSSSKSFFQRLFATIAFPI